MRTHTNGFKENISKLGREIDFKITYTINGASFEIEADDLNSASLHYKGAILKSVMRQLDIDTNINIPLETTLNCQFGIKVNGIYEYINLGSFIVYRIEKTEDTNSFNYVCYDKMLYSMKNYETMNITYPITIKNYLIAICNHLGITFGSVNDNFVNYNKEIPNELYLSTDGTSLDYTFRNVLDEIAQVTASTICMNDNDELEVRYINDTNDTINEEFLNDTNVNFGKIFGPINTVILTRSSGDKISQSIPSDLSDENKIAIEIENNQIMNDNNRADFIPEILNKLYGLEFCINDFASKGIVYYELCDKYNVEIGDNIYPCIMFQEEVNIKQGLEEFVVSEEPEISETNYQYVSNDDRKVNQVYIIAKKNEGEIEAVVSSVQEISTKQSNDYQELLNKFQPIDNTLNKIDNIERKVEQLQTDTYTKTEIQQIANGTGVDGTKVTAVITTSGTFNENGMTYEKTNAPTKSTINEIGLNVKNQNNSSVLFAGYIDENNSPQDLLNKYGDYVNQTIVGTDNIIVNNYLNVGTHSRIQNYGNGTGIFWR